jgi:broad specificity phosphatase PhoE
MSLNTYCIIRAHLLGRGMSKKYLFIGRHGEREDRYSESVLHVDWISTATRPQDPHLSPPGRDEIAKQAEIISKILKDLDGKIVGVYSSPTIRCVETSAIYCKEIQHEKIYVEAGLLEAARCFRGREGSEPRPNWSPLILSATDLIVHADCSLIDTNYDSLVKLDHIHSVDAPNGVAELHQIDRSIANQEQVLYDRVAIFLQRITSFLEALPEESGPAPALLLVTHGAVLKLLAAGMNGKPFEGDVKTGSFGGFVLESGRWAPLIASWTSPSGAEKIERDA